MSLQRSEQSPRHYGRLAELKAVIVGAAGGLGSAIVRRMQAEGASVALLDKDEAALRILAQQLTAKGADPLVIPIDITAAEEVRQGSELVGQLWGSVDILVNAAGISGRPLGDGPVDSCPEETWARVLQVNLTGVYLTCRYFIPLMQRSQRASVIHIASDDALIGPKPPHDTHAYIASKGGVIALTRAMAVSYAPKIRVNAIAPGWIATPMTGDLQEDPAAWQEVIDRHPLARIGTPDDVAWAAVYLASPESAFVTGVILPVEGGATVW